MVAAPEFAAMRPCGGQAEVYADHFIANHRKAGGNGLADAAPVSSPSQPV